uniref:Uncharacterized protein n=1 Tax=Oryza punctata TaxID=4537 RepID=A0A0E0K0L6_ORYPU
MTLPVSVSTQIRAGQQPEQAAPINKSPTPPLRRTRAHKSQLLLCSPPTTTCPFAPTHTQHTPRRLVSLCLSCRRRREPELRSSRSICTDCLRQLRPRRGDGQSEHEAVPAELLHAEGERAAAQGGRAAQPGEPDPALRAQAPPRQVAIAGRGTRRRQRQQERRRHRRRPPHWPASGAGQVSLQVQVGYSHELTAWSHRSGCLLEPLDGDGYCRCLGVCGLTLAVDVN